VSKLIILKLGGSVITAKQSGKPMLRTRFVRRLAEEIAEWYSAAPFKKRTRLVLLYGAGSFGHPLAHRYRLQDKDLDAEDLIGVGRTIAAMRELGTRLADIFLDAGIPIIPLQTSSFVQKKKDHVVCKDYSLIEDILRAGGVPFFGGDVVIADGRRTAIASADTLAAALAAHFRARRILFATDVGGVYRRFPPRRGERAFPVVHRKELQGMLKKRASDDSPLDVTGAMMGKLRALLPLRNCTVVIFDATKAGSLAEVLRNRKRGTIVAL